MIEDNRENHLCQEKIKEKVQKEYYKRVREMLKSKQNSENVINAIITWAVATFRYGVGIISWNKEELDKIDQQTWKPLNMHRGLHPHFSIDRLYIPRAQGGRGLPSVKSCAELEGSSLFYFAHCTKNEVFH